MPDVSPAASNGSELSAAITELEISRHEHGSPQLPGRLGTGQLRDEIFEMLKELRTLKMGTNLTSFTAPGSLMLPFSTTELMLHGSSCSAAGFGEAVREPDVSRRMVRVLSAHLSALSETLSAPMMKPYNPVLGELLVARGGGIGLAWQACIEQVSHHPPLTAFHVEGHAGGGAFRHYGSSGAVPIFRGNTVEVRMVANPGGTVLTLEDGTEEVYRVKGLPSLCLRGVLGIGRSFCEWAGELHIECVTSGLVGKVAFAAAKWFGTGGYHRVQGTVVAGGDKNAPVLYKISGAWTQRVVATATSGGTELEMLPALPGGAERPTGMTALPECPLYDMPAHSLRWERHPKQVWAELTTALKAHDWSAARAAKRKVEEERRQERAVRLASGLDWKPALFELARAEAGSSAAAVADGGRDQAWVLRAGGLDGAFDEEADQPCEAL